MSPRIQGWIGTWICRSQLPTDGLQVDASRDLAPVFLREIDRSVWSGCSVIWLMTRELSIDLSYTVWYCARFRPSYHSSLSIHLLENMLLTRVINPNGGSVHYFLPSCHGSLLRSWTLSGQPFVGHNGMTKRSSEQTGFCFRFLWCITSTELFSIRFEWKRANQCLYL